MQSKLFPPCENNFFNFILSILEKDYGVNNEMLLYDI